MHQHDGNIFFEETYIDPVLLKVISKFFLKHNKSFRWHLGDYEKHDFFPLEGL